MTVTTQANPPLIGQPAGLRAQGRYRNVTTDDLTPCSLITTGVDGLAIIVGIDGWCVMHVRSGIGLGWYTREPEQAIAFAHAVASIDWTQPARLIVADADNVERMHTTAERFGMIPLDSLAADRHLDDIE